MPQTRPSFHDATERSIVRSLLSSSSGLSEHEAKKRLAANGPNELEEAKKASVLSIFINQFKSLIVLALALASALSLAMGEYKDVAVIVAVLLVNAFIGTFQEYRAEKAIEALKRMSATSARVMRDGRQHKIPARELVIGDIIMLEVGDRVPADARLLESANLAINESAFTGESVPAKKSACTLPAKTPLPDRENMAYKDTIVTSGRCKAVVVSTGMSTEIGHIAKKLEGEEHGETPLQKKISDFMKHLGKMVIIGMVFVAIVGTFVAQLGAEEVARLAIAQAVSFIPEGLPIMLTVVLAVGVGDMAKKRAIARRLSAVETLGCVTAICTDKTGTLTKNEMTVKEIYINGQHLHVGGVGYFAQGRITHADKEVRASGNGGLERILKIASLCNDASIAKERGEAVVIGDPTEGALLVVAKKAGLSKESLDYESKRLGEVQFDPEKKYMATFNRSKGGMMANVKGAPETVLSRCTHVLIDGKEVALTKKERMTIIHTNHAMASKALRVLGFAYKRTQSAREGELKGMVFAGLIGMFDPPREEARDAIAACKESGIKVVMITGDHQLTAIGIAKQLGMHEDGHKSITGAELDAMGKKEFMAIVDHVSVYARMSGEHKLRIVQALQQKGHIVAMTGDGVNDALAIKKANVGIAMGQGGTEVTKESSDLILTDDNFATIVSAIEEGRGAYANIQKVVSYLIATNFGEIIFLFAILLSGIFLPEALPLALLPIHILWVNLITDGACTLTLAMEPKEVGLMRLRPRDPKEPLITLRMAVFIAITAIMMAAGTFAVFYTQLDSGLSHARTMAFTTLAMFQLFSAYNARSEQSVFKVGLFSNKYLLGGIIVSLIVQLFAIYAPFMNDIIHTTPLILEDWAVIFATASSVFAIFEIKKFMDSAWSPVQSERAGASGG